jgi:hypothetical protein
MNSFSPQTAAAQPNVHPQTNAQTFPQFKSLPFELRFRIYKFAIVPRLVPIFAYPLSYIFGINEVRRLLDENGWNGVGPLLCLTAERLFTTPNLITPLLHVDSETRNFVLSQGFQPMECARYPTAEYDSSVVFLNHHGRNGDRRGNPRPKSFLYLRAIPIQNQQYVLADPRTDVFFLEGPRLPQVERVQFVLSAIDAAVRWIDPYFLENLRRLAVLYYIFRNASNSKYLSTLTEFKALEELYISFLCCKEQLPSRD